MAIKFNQAVKHERLQFIPGVALKFKDAKAEDYFVAAGWAEKTKEKPAHTYEKGSVEIDPDTISADTGKKVLEG